MVVLLSLHTTVWKKCSDCKNNPIQNFVIILLEAQIVFFVKCLEEAMERKQQDRFPPNL